MQKKSFRVYFISHHDGRLTGILMRTWDYFWDSPLPSAYGETEEDVYSQLELTLRGFELSGKDNIDRYLWEESFATRQILVEIHPHTMLKKRAVIGEKRIPLKLSYTFCRMKNGAYRVMLPRFNWWFLLESLEIAPEVLKNAVSSALLGERPRWIYDFRHEGPEYVREWSPRLAARPPSSHDEERRPAPPALASVAEELVDKAARQKLPPVVGEEDTLVQYLPHFTRFPPSSLLLVGGPGSGKTTFVRRMARLFASWHREKKIEQNIPRIWATSGDRIIAGMIYLGMWQERCLRLVNELSHQGDYLYVDRLTAILRPQSDGASIADLLYPALAAEEISLIAECDEAELERSARRFPAFLQCFQILRIPPTSPAAMPALLAQYQARKGSAIHIHPAGLKRLVAHLEMFQRDHLFPGKGFRFLDWLNQEASQEKSRTLYPREISEAYSRFSGLPLELISDEHPAPPAVIAKALKKGVIGQDEACDVSARVLARFKAGLNDPEKPCGSLFFVGPTGVGKTELAKQLARYMFGDESRMIRLDMSEYMLPGSGERLLEVGEGTNSLAQKVRQQPLSLVLLDEIEKAHPEVFDLLLGILGEGRLTDSMGRLVDFRMTLIIMTSNLGVSEAGALGFGEKDTGRFERSVRQHFRPEFFNRIDHVLSFRNLSPEDVLRIVDLEIAKASVRTGLMRRQLRLTVSPPARELLAKLGYHPTRGARPLRRVIEERVITPIAVRIAQDPSFRDKQVMILKEEEIREAPHLAERYELLPLREEGAAVG